MDQEVFTLCHSCARRKSERKSIVATRRITEGVPTHIHCLIIGIIQLHIIGCGVATLYFINNNFVGRIQASLTDPNRIWIVIKCCGVHTSALIITGTKNTASIVVIRFRLIVARNRIIAPRYTARIRFSRRSIILCRMTPVRAIAIIQCRITQTNRSKHIEGCSWPIGSVPRPTNEVYQYSAAIAQRQAVE